MSPNTLICITLLCTVNSVLALINITSEDTTLNVSASREETWDRRLGISLSVSNASKTWDGLMTALNSTRSSSLSDVISAVSISPGCRQSFRKFWSSLADWEAWAVQMADASGGWPSGILAGRVSSFGSFDQCLQIRAADDQSPDLNFQGQYCMLGFQSPLLAEMYEDKGTRTQLNEKYEDMHGKPPEWVADFLQRSGPRLLKLNFFLGTCVPSTCTGEEVATVYEKVSRQFGFNVTRHHCEMESEIIWDTSDIVAMSFFLLIAVLCILGTAADIICKCLYGDEDCTKINNLAVLNWVLAFSVPANMTKLFGKEQQQRAASCLAAGSLDFLDGMRVLSLIFIISYHTSSTSNEEKLALYRNFFDATEGWDGYLRSIALDHANEAVGTFFSIRKKESCSEGLN